MQCGYRSYDLSYFWRLTKELQGRRLCSIHIVKFCVGIAGFQVPVSENEYPLTHQRPTGKWSVRKHKF
jgi:hypothetical protein